MLKLKHLLCSLEIACLLNLVLPPKRKRAFDYESVHCVCLLHQVPHNIAFPGRNLKFIHWSFQRLHLPAA
uniref:Putative secreted protein n=1 Tax=Rhipicephalus microplus TaxID=6941 RepID=A0A6G5A0J6_RHIMP